MKAEKEEAEARAADIEQGEKTKQRTGRPKGSKTRSPEERAAEAERTERAKGEKAERRAAKEQKAEDRAKQREASGRTERDHGGHTKRYTPEQMQSVIEAFFKDDRIAVHSEASMCLALGITQENLRDYEKDTNSSYGEIIKNARLRREAELLAIGKSDPKLSSLVIFCLKQSTNGGYTDRQQESGDKAISITINGMDSGKASG